MKVFQGFISAVAFLAVSASVWGQSLPPGPKVRIEAVTQPTPTVPQWTQIEVPILREGMKQRSGGRVEFVLATWPERNVTGPEVLRLLRRGQVDISSSLFTTVSGDVPLLDAADLAGMNLNATQARKVVEALVPAANKELEPLGIKIIGTFPYTGQVMFCRKPLKTLADLKNLNVRVPGPSAGDLVRALGGNPVSMTFGEVYTALERGTVDCNITGSNTGIAMKYTDITTHMYTLPLYWATSAYFVNLAWWNKLDPAVRTFLEQTFAEISDKEWKLGADLTQDAIDCSTGHADACKHHALARRPLVEVKATAAEQKMIEKAVADQVLPNWVKRCGDRCGVIYNEAIAKVSGVPYAKP